MCIHWFKKLTHVFRQHLMYCECYWNQLSFFWISETQKVLHFFEPYQLVTNSKIYRHHIHGLIIIIINNEFGNWIIHFPNSLYRSAIFKLPLKHAKILHPTSRSHCFLNLNPRYKVFYMGLSFRRKERSTSSYHLARKFLHWTNWMHWDKLDVVSCIISHPCFLVLFFFRCTSLIFTLKWNETRFIRCLINLFSNLSDQRNSVEQSALLNVSKIGGNTLQKKYMISF